VARKSRRFIGKWLRGCRTQAAGDFTPEDAALMGRLSRPIAAREGLSKYLGVGECLRGVRARVRAMA
jgi:hypothetical protein